MKKKTIDFSFSCVSKIVLLAFVFSVAFLIFSANEVKAKDGYAVIDCWCDKDHAFSSIGETYKDHNGMYKNDTMHWLLMGPVGTTITITFSEGDSCLGTVPFTDQTNPITGTVTLRNDHKFDDITRKIKDVMPDQSCYHYDISCSNWTAQQSQSAKTDPIIDVPPKP